MSQIDINVDHDCLQRYNLSSKDWGLAQKQDSVIAQVPENVRNGTKPTQPLDSKFSNYLWELKNLVILHGVLYRKTLACREERLQIVLPENPRNDKFKALHYDLGHQGRDRTTSLFKERFLLARNGQLHC